MKPTTIHFVKRIFPYSKQAFRLFTLTLLLFTSFIVLNWNAYSQPVCKLEQITNDPVQDSDQPTISRDGNLIAFRSEANFTGQNPDNNDEIFFYNVFEQKFSQVTVTTTGGNFSPFFSPDGKFIVFASDADINGAPPNVNEQIYIYDVMTGIIEQITNGTDGDSDDPVINGLNTHIAFRSLADLTGDNPLNEDQIFLYDILANSFNQITNSTSGVTVFPTINFAGDRVAFESSANLTGQNPVAGIRQIFLYNSDTDILSQITNNTAGSGSSVTDSAIDGSGNFITLSANSNPNGGGSNFPTGRRQIYLFDGFPPIEQITMSQEALSAEASIGGNGSCIVFDSGANITGQNPGGFDEIFLYDIDAGLFTQVTNFQSSNDPRNPRPNADCTRIAFSRFIQFNSNVLQIYVATCLDPATARNIPTLSEWGLIAMAGVLGVVGLMAIRRRKATA